LIKKLQMKDEATPLIRYTSLFNKQRKAAPLEIKIAFRDTLELFLENSHHPQLRNHPLKEEYAGYNSIDVTDDWRALFRVRESETQTIITFHILGTHEELYGEEK